MAQGRTKSVMQKYQGPSSTSDRYSEIDHRVSRMTVEPARGDSSMRELLRIISYRHRVIAASVAIGAIPLALVAAVLPAAYTATAHISVMSKSAMPATSDARVAQMILDTHVVSLKSREFLSHAFSNIEREQPGFAAATQGPSRSLFQSVFLFGAPSFEQRLETFQKMLDVSQAQSSSIVSVRFTSTSPLLAASAANVVASLYVSSSREAEEEGLRAELDRVAIRLRELQQSQAMFQSRLQSQLAPTAGGTNEERDRSAVDDVARADAQITAGLMRRQIAVRRQLDAVEPRLWIVSQAYPPVVTSSPNSILLLVPGIVLLLVGSCYWAIVRERLDRPIRSALEATRNLAIPCLGELPSVGRARPEQLAVTPSSAFAESIAAIAAAVEMPRTHRPAEIILLSRADPSACSTPLALGLARYAASKGRRVLLIDADVLEPRLSRHLHQNVEHDLVDVVVDARDPADAIRHDTATGCDVLPVRARMIDPLPPAIEMMRAALDRLRASYDIILVDAPPAVELTDAATADCVLVVVTWGTAVHQVAKSLRKLRGHPTNSSGRLATVIVQVPHHESQGHSWLGGGLVPTDVHRDAWTPPPRESRKA